MEQELVGVWLQIVGLTGGIGCGASTVAKMLKQKGIDVIEADAIARSLINPESIAWRKLVRVFGARIIGRNKEIDRQALGTAAFYSKKALGQLNKIMLPEIIKKIKQQIRAFKKKKKEIVFLDAPLLLEAGLHKISGILVVVNAGKETRIKRIMPRDYFSRGEAIKRINAQIPLEEKTRRADFVIDNNGTVKETKKQLEKILKKIKQKKE